MKRWRDGKEFCPRRTTMPFPDASGSSLLLAMSRCSSYLFVPSASSPLCNQSHMNKTTDRLVCLPFNCFSRDPHFPLVISPLPGVFLYAPLSGFTLPLPVCFKTAVRRLPPPPLTSLVLLSLSLCCNHIAIFLPFSSPSQMNEFEHGPVVR